MGGMELSADRQEELTDSLARGLSRWGLGTAAIALLQGHQSLSFIASQTLLVSEPSLTQFLPYDWLERETGR
jgi:hypothetical protein